jgi:hypothetical protein
MAAVTPILGAMPLPQTLAPQVRDALDVDAQLTFVSRPDRPAYLYVFDPPAGVSRENAAADPRTVRIRNARAFEPPPSLHREGFQLARLQPPLEAFDDAGEIERLYYPAVAQAVRQACNAAEVIVFDHLVRRRAAQAGPFSALGRDATPSEYAGPAGRVHNDYSAASGHHRLNKVLGRAEDTPWPGRFAIVNVWRSARGPVLDAPLALCDARTVAADDLVDTELRYPHRTGAIYQVAFNPAQRWSYFHELQWDEALLFKQFDSDPAQPRFTPHGAFQHPGTPAGAPPRQSIEARCLVLF